MKRLVLALVTLSILFYHWRNQKKPSTQISNAALSAKAPEEILNPLKAKNGISINVPKTGTRQPTSDNPEGEDTRIFLNKWWARIPVEQRHLYSMALSSRNPLHETYQVMFKNMPIDGLVVQRRLTAKQNVDPFPMFKVADDHDLIGGSAAKNKVLASDSNILKINSVEAAWEIRPNQVLRPIYKVTAEVSGAIVAQTWIVNAKTGEIASINTHTRR